MPREDAAEIRRSFGCLLLLTATAAAHEGHTHGPSPLTQASGSERSASGTAQAAPPAAPARVTGQGDLRFRYNAELSELPREIAKGLKPAHGAIAKGPQGELYFGLEGTGLVRVSADLEAKSIISTDGRLSTGGMHDAEYLPHRGGMLVLPDNKRGQLHFAKLTGEVIRSVGRPDAYEHFENPRNGYAPTSVAVGPDGLLYVCDGYQSRLVLTLDLGSMDYTARYFGGVSKDPLRQSPGKYSTNHGVALGEDGESLLIADRECRWLQRVTPDGDYVEGFQVGGARPCGIDFVEFGGEQLMVVGCLRGPDNSPGVVQLYRQTKGQPGKWEIVSTLRPKIDLGLEAFRHVHNAIGVVRGDRLYVLCYGWNPGCYAVLERTPN